MGTIASKAVNGNSNEDLMYEYLDGQPLTGINFYRLKQIDFDGRSSLSPVIKLKNQTEGLRLTLYPNPVKDKLTLSIHSIEKGSYQLTILDASGKVIQQQQLAMNEGRNQADLNVGDLPGEIYFIKITSKKGDEQTQTFTK